MRILHRYLGFFMIGMVLVYAFTGIALLFRDSFALKTSIQKDIKLEHHLNQAELTQKITETDELHLRHFEVKKKENDTMFFSKNRYNTEGFYAIRTGELQYTQKEYPLILKKLIDFHKSKAEDPYSAINIIFGLSLFFFIFSSFFMFNPQSSIFKKGMVFIGAGVIITLILLILI